MCSNVQQFYKFSCKVVSKMVVARAHVHRTERRTGRNNTYIDCQAHVQSFIESFIASNVQISVHSKQSKFDAHCV